MQQVLVDTALHNDWMVELEVDLAASREANQPVLWLWGSVRCLLTVPGEPMRT